MRFVSVDTPDQIPPKALAQGPLAIDCETDSKDPMAAKLLRVIVSDGETAVSMAADCFKIPEAPTYYFQNAEYDIIVLKRHGLDLTQHEYLDTMLMHHLIDESAEHSLDAQVKLYFKDNYKDVFWSKYDSYEAAPRDAQLEYECKDAIYTYTLAVRYSDVLEGKSELITQVHELARHLMFTRLQGVNLDMQNIAEEGPKTLARIDELYRNLRPCVEDHCKVWELQAWLKELEKRKTPKGKAGVKKPEFNFSSATQVQWLLYDALELPIVATTKSGSPSTDFDALDELSGKHPVVDTLRDYKNLKTVYTTFIEGLVKRQVDGVIHPEFNVNGTVTGRISSSNPNLQNMPKEGPYRGFFVPSDGSVFFGADYSQLEVVVEANLSGDKQLRRVILDGISKHDITNDALRLGDRNKAKTLNFALQYGASHYKVAQILDISKQEAQRVYDEYWRVYSGVSDLKRYTDRCVADGVPIVNPFGRERRISGPFASLKDEGRAKRQAYNSLIQGTGADITHTAFVLAANFLKEEGIGRMIFPVHDEVLGEVVPSQVEYAKGQVAFIMESISDKLGWELPLKAVTYGPLTKWSKC